MFTQEKADAVCEAIASGMSLRKAAEVIGVDHSTVLFWARERPEFANQYARARDIGTDVEFDALSDIQSEQPERGPSGGVDPGWVAWKRLQIDTKKWEIAKKAPKKYGEKVESTLELGDSVTKIVREIVRG
jgi:hypothetical protein